MCAYPSLGLCSVCSVLRELTSRNEFWPTDPNKDVDLSTTLEMLEDVLTHRIRYIFQLVDSPVPLSPSVHF